MPCVARPRIFPVKFAPTAAVRAMPILLVFERLVTAALAMRAGGFGACNGAQHGAFLAYVVRPAVRCIVNSFRENGTDRPSFRPDVAVRNLLSRCSALRLSPRKSKIRKPKKTNDFVILISISCKQNVILNLSFQHSFMSF